MTENRPTWAQIQNTLDSRQAAIKNLRPWSRFYLKTVYDRDDFPRDSLYAALPGFEYPDWDYYPIRDFINLAMRDIKRRREASYSALARDPIIEELKAAARSALAAHQEGLSPNFGRLAAALEGLEETSK